MADRLDELDYYTLLRVEETASADAIREAFHAFALKYHPDRFAGAPDAKRERAAQIFRRGAEGYRILLDPPMRAKYDKAMHGGKMRLTAEDERTEELAKRSQSGGLGVRSAKARPFVTKASMAMKKGDLKTAKLNLKLALTHEPGNSLLEARLAEVERQLQKS
ncbi:MAG: DnaJ domain-containing protein [Sandaracinaceae bacterium]|nr:DnaJ domain-containing protein [Sandaracinaceae bacterium]